MTTPLSPRHGRPYRAFYTTTVPGEDPTVSPYIFRFDSRDYNTPFSQACAVIGNYCDRYGLELTHIVLSDIVRPAPVAPVEPIETPPAEPAHGLIEAALVLEYRKIAVALSTIRALNACGAHV